MPVCTIEVHTRSELSMIVTRKQRESLQFVRGRLRRGWDKFRLGRTRLFDKFIDKNGTVRAGVPNNMTDFKRLSIGRN